MGKKKTTKAQNLLERLDKYQNSFGLPVQLSTLFKEPLNGSHFFLKGLRWRSEFITIQQGAE